jgi:hypothetical protein
VPILKQKRRFLSIFRGCLNFFNYLEGAGLTEKGCFGIFYTDNMAQNHFNYRFGCPLRDALGQWWPVR